jgi:hypothetical protein
LNKDEIYYFEDCGYQHDLYQHRPLESKDTSYQFGCPSSKNKAKKKRIDYDQQFNACLKLDKIRNMLQ